MGVTRLIMGLTPRNTVFSEADRRLADQKILQLSSSPKFYCHIHNSCFSNKREISFTRQGLSITGPPSPKAPPNSAADRGSFDAYIAAVSDNLVVRNDCHPIVNTAK